MAACTEPSYDSTNPLANGLEISSVIEQVNVDLSTANCSDALYQISPLYNSANSNNQIRLATASAYGCDAKINLFNVVNDFSNFKGNLAGSGFFEFLVEEFPSVANPDDKVPQSAEDGTDAAMATLNNGTVLVTDYTINSTTYNPGSLLYTDRVNDANAFLTFLSMSLIGSLLNRYGDPTANHHKSVALPWTSAATTPGDGCALASALLNFDDGIVYISAASPPNIQSTYNSIQSFFGPALQKACTEGCTFCGGSVSCTTCPTTLRSRASCTGSTTDVNSCAAAGLVSFVNDVWDGPP